MLTICRCVYVCVRVLSGMTEVTGADHGLYIHSIVLMQLSVNEYVSQQTRAMAFNQLLHTIGTD